ncbi:hypothetical protein BZA77DRAFT_317257 [Pyronema omphalodes]|nr:hypothetical protein BZA77DRAFT_317257 [Pyronema omphalodes]
MSSLGPFVGKTVTILTSDGRILTGQLLGHDQTTNLILSSTVERIFSPPDSEEQSQEVEHGLYLIRGDNVAVCGLVDEEREGGIDWTMLKAQPLGGVKHS